MNSKGITLVVGIVVFLVLIAVLLLSLGGSSEDTADTATTTDPTATSTPIVATSTTIDTSDWEISYDPDEVEGLVRVSTPTVGMAIASPLIISGEARGYWFFEASAPVVLTNWDGLIIAEGYITAEGDWMTEDFVPFTGTLTFTKPSFGERGFLIMKNDNPSGLPENDKSLEIPILFQ